MNNEEKEMLKNHHTQMLRILKSSVYTFAVLVLIGTVQSILFPNGGDLSIIVVSIIAIIFLIFYFAITILEEVRKPK